MEHSGVGKNSKYLPLSAGSDYFIEKVLNSGIKIRLKIIHISFDYSFI